MLSGANPGAKKGCTISLTGKCKHCPHYRTMPFDVTDPTTGQIIRSGQVVDCTFAFMTMGAWDAGRQTEMLHSGVNQAQNEANRRQEELIGFVAGHIGQERQQAALRVIPDADDKS